MRNILPDNQMRALSLAMVSAVVAAVGIMFMPVGVLEGLTGSTGLSELIGAAKPPLGDTARALMAFGAGALTLAVLAFVLLRQEQPAPFGGDDNLGEEKQSVVRGLLSKLEMPKMPWVKGEDDITELADLPKLKNGDSHPDAPARRPLSRTDLPTINGAEMPVVESASEAGPGEMQTRPISEPSVLAEPVPVVEPVPAEDFKPSLADMVAQLEAAVAERKKQLADLEIVAAQLGASNAGRNVEVPRSVESSVPRPPLEAVPNSTAKDEHMDDALASALATLHRMNDDDR